MFYRIFLVTITNLIGIDERVIYQLIFKSYDINQKKEILQETQKGIGGIQLLWGDYSIYETQKLTEEIYRNCLEPPFISIDYEGGTVYLHQTHGLLNIPSNMAIANSSDTKNTPTLFFLAGLELKKAGINSVFAPTLDVNTNPRNKIINIRSFSDNPEIVYRFGELVVDGFLAAGIIPTLKHFPGHGMVEEDSHVTLPKTKIKKEELYKIHIFPFKKIIEKNKIDIIMTSHVLYEEIDNKLPASLSKKIMTDILRNELKYQGIIITDSLDMKAITKNYKIEEASILSLKNGADMLLIGRYKVDKVVKRIKKALINGEIKEDEILEKYQRIQKIKGKNKLREFNLYHDNFDLAYKKIAEEISVKSIKLKKCTNIDVLKTSSELDLLFIFPQRYLKEAVIIYSYFKKINNNAEMYTNINQLKKNKKTKSSIIIFSYFWPHINREKIDEIKELTKNYKYKAYVNVLNPYDSQFLIDDFNCIVETYGINEFSAKSLGEYFTKIVNSSN